MDKTDPRDKKLKKDLKKLFNKWRRAIKDKDPLKKLFIIDGALPGYSKRKTKILFLPREMHTTKGLKKDPKKRNIVEFVDAFLGSSNRSSEAYAVKQIKTDGNDLQCWRLSARIAYSVFQGGKIGLWKKLSLKEFWEKPSFEELQSAYNKNKFSFAILEISKYNNVVRTMSAPGISKKHFKPSVDQGLGMKAYASQEENFIRQEIELLNPDLIISWNIRSAIAKQRFNKLLTGNHKQDPKKISCNFLPDRAWTYTFNKRRDASTGEIKQIPLLDSWHFSVDDRRKNRQKELFNPIMKALKKLGLI